MERFLKFAVPTTFLIALLTLGVGWSGWEHNDPSPIRPTLCCLSDRHCSSISQLVTGLIDALSVVLPGDRISPEEEWRRCRSISRNSEQATEHIDRACPTDAPEDPARCIQEATTSLATLKRELLEWRYVFKITLYTGGGLGGLALIFGIWLLILRSKLGWRLEAGG